MATWLNLNFEHEFKLEKASLNRQEPFLSHDQDMAYMPEIIGIENHRQKFESESCPQHLAKQYDIGSGIVIASNPSQNE